MLKVGVFGVGHLGKFHLNNWKQIPTVELVGFFDPNNERHVAFKAAELAGPITTDGLRTLEWRIPMEIVFNKKRVSRPIFMDAPYPYTILIPKGLIQVTNTGDSLNPFSIEMGGERGTIGMAVLLPLDFDISQP